MYACTSARTEEKSLPSVSGVKNSVWARFAPAKSTGRFNAEFTLLFSELGTTGAADGWIGGCFFCSACGLFFFPENAAPLRFLPKLIRQTPPLRFFRFLFSTDGCPLRTNPPADSRQGTVPPAP